MFEAMSGTGGNSETVGKRTIAVQTTVCGRWRQINSRHFWNGRPSAEFSRAVRRY